MDSAQSSQMPTAGRALKIRAGLVIGALWIVFALLIARLAHLQIAEADFYSRQASHQQILKHKLSARRGRIYDRKGRLLAVSVPRYSIFGDPHGVRDPDRTAALLARLLDLSAGRLARDLRRDCYFVWIKRQVSDRLAAQVRSLDLPGIHMRKESKRLYPQGSLAAHVIGFTDIDGRGLAGLERRMDALLRGRPGMEEVRCDGGRRIFRTARETVMLKPSDGLDVHLSIDAYIQEIAESELARAVEKHQPECAGALVLDARDCSVLAMAGRPTFDPQAPAASPMANQRNLAITDVYEFGSVMKPFPVGLALDGGVVGPETEFDCHDGLWQIGRRTLHDAHEYGMLTVSDILCHSSNIGAAQISMELGAEKLYAGLHEFGFAEPTGIALPGEVGGIVRPLDAWNRYSVVSVSFGQEMAVTPLAVARAFSVFANSGLLLQPRIVDRVVNGPDGEAVYEADDPMVSHRVLSPSASQAVTQMLRRVVAEGTGRRAQIEGYPVAGKTGTAQLLREDGRGYSDSRYLASFVGMAPVPRTRLIVLVCLKNPTENGYYGGVAAAPAVRNILRRALRYLQVPPTETTDEEVGESA